MTFNALLLFQGCDASTGSEIAGCISGVVESDNSNKIFANLQTIIDFMYWGLAVLAIGSVIAVGWRLILSRIGNDPNQSAAALKGLSYIAIALIIAAGSVTITDIFLGA